MGVDYKESKQVILLLFFPPHFPQRGKQGRKGMSSDNRSIETPDVLHIVRLNGVSLKCLFNVMTPSKKIEDFLSLTLPAFNKKH